MTDHMIEIQKQNSLIFIAFNLTYLSQFARLNSVLYRYLVHLRNSPYLIIALRGYRSWAHLKLYSSRWILVRYSVSPGPQSLSIHAYQGQ